MPTRVAQTMAYPFDFDAVDSSASSQHPYPLELPVPADMKRRGLFWRFFVFAFKLGLVGFVVLLLIAWRLWTMIAASTPQMLPPLKLDAAQQAQLKQRCDRYMWLLNAGKNPGPVAFTADELNVFIDSEKNLRGRLRVEMSGDRLFAHVAIPYDPPRRKDDFLGNALRGRWLNASASFSISLSNSDFSIRVESLALDGWPIPSFITSRFLGQNFADAWSQTDRRQFASKFESLSIRDGKLILTPKQPLVGPVRPAAAK